MDLAGQIFSHGWLGNALSVFTLGYYPATTGIEGNASITLDDLTVSANGKVLIVGAATFTLGDVIITASGEIVLVPSVADWCLSDTSLNVWRLNTAAVTGITLSNTTVNNIMLGDSTLSDIGLMDTHLYRWMLSDETREC